MSNFDFKRFRLLVLYELKINMRTNLRTTLGMAVGLLLMYMIYTWKIFRPHYGISVENYLSQMSGSTTIAFMVFMAVGASLIFINMKTKQQHTAFCMLPASNAEKFAVRWLWSTVGFALMFAAASVLADAVCALFTLAIWHTHEGSVVMWAIHQALDMKQMANDRLTNEDAAILVYIISCFMLIHSVYILGGTLFRRYAPLYTTMVIIAVAITLISTDNFPYLFKRVLGYSIYGNEATVMWCYTATCVVLTALCYIWAWQLFRRSQVINNKLLNV